MYPKERARTKQKILRTYESDAWLQDEKFQIRRLTIISLVVKSLFECRLEIAAKNNFISKKSDENADTDKELVEVRVTIEIKNIER